MFNSKGVQIGRWREIMPMLGFLRFILRLLIVSGFVEKVILKIKYLGWFVTLIANPRPEQPKSTYG
jgi:hypothetical protein